MTTTRAERAQLLADAKSAADFAQQSGLTLEEAERTLLVFDAMTHRSAKQWKRRLSLLGAVVTVLCVGALGLTAKRALAAGSCAQTLPAPLTTLCADSPALAQELNDNENAMVGFIQQKVGTVGNANIVNTGNISTSGTMTATGAVSGSSVTGGSVTSNGLLTANRISVPGGTIQSGGATITATGDLGLYSLNTGAWMRLVTNNGPLRYFSSPGAQNIGATYNFSVETSGTTTSTQGGEPEGTQQLPNAFCVVVPQGSGCPTNWDAREVKWDTEDSSNADQGKDGKIAWDDGNTGSVRMRFCCRGGGW